MLVVFHISAVQAADNDSFSYPIATNHTYYPCDPVIMFAASASPIGQLCRNVIDCIEAFNSLFTKLERGERISAQILEQQVQKAINVRSALKLRQEMANFTPFANSLRKKDLFLDQYITKTNRLRVRMISTQESS